MTAGSATAPVDEGGSPFSTPRHEGEPCTQEEPQHSPGSSPPRRLGPRSLSGLLASSLPHAVVSKASELLPGGTISGRLACLSTSLSTSLSRRRGRSPAPPPPPPPLAVPVRLLGGGEAAQLQLPAEASLTQLQQGAWERAGVPPALQRLCIQERRGEPGLVNLLRSTATQLTSREHLSRSMLQWVNYLFLPESVNKEIKGTGLISWTADNVWVHLARREPGRVQVSVALLSDRRYSLVLPEGATLRRLQAAVEKQTGVPPERQELFVAEQRQQGWLEQILWSALRLLVSYWRAVFGAAATALAAIFPPEDDSFRVQVQGEDGRQVAVRLRGDVTLAQLHDLLEQQEGEGFRVRSVQLTGGPAPGSAGR